MNKCVQTLYLQRIISGFFLPRLPIRVELNLLSLQKVGFPRNSYAVKLLEKQRRKYFLELTVMKHKADAPDCRDWHSTVRHILLAIKSLSGPITWSTDRSAAQKIKLILQQDQRVMPFLSPPRSFSYPQRQHSADRCCGDCRWR